MKLILYLQLDKTTFAQCVRLFFNLFEHTGWYDPFADRFPDQSNTGNGRDFVRVPAKFPNVSQADRDANFSIWLSEKKEMYKNRPKTADAPKNIGRGKVIQKRTLFPQNVVCNYR